MKKVKFTSESPDQTLKIAARIAKKLHGDEIIELVGDVGSGKTTFVGGLVGALDIDEHVTSPTFTIENEYSGKFTVYHLDFYRMDEAGIMAFDLADKIGKGIIIIEWSEVVKNVLPKNRITINFEVTPEDYRSIIVKVPDSSDFALEETR